MARRKLNAVEKRLQQTVDKTADWKHWGPYVSERAWGTVREDYSADGSAWDYFPFEASHQRAYRWNEDGIAGICDRHQNICFAVSMWNENDSILKERLFGLAGPKGNHGEDVKEYYYYLDNTPTHCSMRYLYKYPHAAFPYEDLYKENARRDKSDREYELIDTGIFDENRYFDVFVEYAKAGPEDICIKITAVNRGPETAPLHLLPTVWFRNTWSWANEPKPIAFDAAKDRPCAPYISKTADDPLHALLRRLARLFVLRERERITVLCSTSANTSAFTKDGIGNYIVHRDQRRSDPQRSGTKAAAALRS